MPVETPALAEMRDRLQSAKPSSWIEAMVASMSCRRRISSMPILGTLAPCARPAPISAVSAHHVCALQHDDPRHPSYPEVRHIADFILVDQSKKNLGLDAKPSYRD